ncbi:beta/gamma crystallin domain-containing protein [Streptomyces sp. NPDC002676]
MKLPRHTRLSGLVTALAALAALAGTAAPAQALNRVDCGNRTDFLAFHNDGKVCFANAGHQDVAIYGVTKITAGNNAGRVMLQQAEGWPLHSLDFGKYEIVTPGSYPWFHKITGITVY